MESYVIRFTPSLKQFRAYEYLTDTKTTFIGYGGSAFSGKSYLLCYWITIMCLGYADTAWGIGRKQLTVLKKTTLITLFKVFDECGLKDQMHYNYNQQLNYITFYNKSRIYLIDTAYQPSDPLYTRFGGFELTGAAIDESNETDYTAIEILSTRIGRRNNHEHGLKAKMLETFNPAKNHVYNRYYHPYKISHEKPGYVFIPALPKDNPSPEAAEYIKNILATAGKVTVERLVHGNFDYDDNPDALCDRDSIMAIFGKNVAAPSTEFYSSADVARFGSDKAIILVWRGFAIVDYIIFDISKTTEIQTAINSLRVKHRISKDRIVVDDDGVGGGVVDNLGVQGFVNNATPLENPEPKRDSKGNVIKENYFNLQSQCAYKLAEKINNREIVFECELPESLKEDIAIELEQIQSYSADSDGKLRIKPKALIKEDIGRSPDWRDVLLMRMYFEYKRPIRNNLSILTSFA